MPTWHHRPKARKALLLCAETAARKKNDIYNCSILNRQCTIKNIDSQIKVLRRWNSSTPLYSKLARGEGGYYYLIWNHKGVLIDPGFNFAQIFEREFRSIEDVDLVVVSHDHPDHCNGLPDLLTLLHEFNEGRRRPHIVRFAVSQGTYSKFLSLLRAANIRQHVTKLLPNSRFKLLPDVIVSTVRNKHPEICRKCDGIGLRFSLRYDSKTYTLGVTSDTGYHSRLSKFYDGVDMLILHIGTLEKPRSRKLLTNHLGFKGIVLTLKDMKKPPTLALVSEWGEELWGMRREIVEHLESRTRNTHILPADMSLAISIPKNEIYVEEDAMYVSAKNVFVSEDQGDRLRYKAR